jgi:hypothetical protein
MARSNGPCADQEIAASPRPGGPAGTTPDRSSARGASRSTSASCARSSATPSRSTRQFRQQPAPAAKGPAQTRPRVESHLRPSMKLLPSCSACHSNEHGLDGDRTCGCVSNRRMGLNRCCQRFELFARCVWRVGADGHADLLRIGTSLFIKSKEALQIEVSLKLQSEATEPNPAKSGVGRERNRVATCECMQNVLGWTGDWSVSSSAIGSSDSRTASQTTPAPVARL